MVDGEKFLFDEAYKEVGEARSHFGSHCNTVGTRRRGHVDVFLCAPIMRALFFFFRSMLCL